MYSPPRSIFGSVVHVHDVLALLAVALHDEGLHLLHGEIGRNDLGNAEESRLQDGAGAVAQTNLLADLRSVDVVHLDVVLAK